jgi:hypothetical protein
VTLLDCSTVEVRITSSQPEFLNDSFSGSGALNGQSFSINISNSTFTIGANGVFQDNGTVSGSIEGGDCDPNSSSYTSPSWGRRAHRRVVVSEPVPDPVAESFPGDYHFYACLPGQRHSKAPDVRFGLVAVGQHAPS